MDNFENISSSVLALISAVVIFLYYLNSKKSKCFDCEVLIHHRKLNRYSINIVGEDQALCKACYQKRKKQEALPAVHCSCCLALFTTRMKVHDWSCHDETKFLCSSCNKKASLKLSRTFELSTLLNDSFIDRTTNKTTFSSYVSGFGIPITSQDDLKSKEWNEYIENTSTFGSWKCMEWQALKELELSQRKEIIAEICK